MSAPQGSESIRSRRRPNISQSASDFAIEATLQELQGPSSIPEVGSVLQDVGVALPDGSVPDDINLPEGFALSVVRPSWRGIESLRAFVVFGDAYSLPISTYFEEEDLEEPANWVDKFVFELHAVPSTSDVCRIIRYVERDHTVENHMDEKLEDFFSDFPPKAHPAAPSALSPHTTLYAVWLGINDCGFSFADQAEEIVDSLFAALRKLYFRAGARNFLLLDVPPIDRSEAAIGVEDDVRKTVETWNAALRKRAAAFAKNRKHASVFLFSTHEVLTTILRDTYRFSIVPEGVWDERYVTDEVHTVLTECLLGAFQSVAN